MAQQIKVLLFAKSIDGGTGTFFNSITKIPQTSVGKVIIIPVVLEKPKFRKEFIPYTIFLHKKNYYPLLYRFSINNIVRFLKEIILIRHQVKRFQPDVILSIDSHCNLLILLNKLFFLKIKVIATTHNQLSSTFSKKSSPLLLPLLRVFVLFFYNQADKLVCVSEGNANDLKKVFGIKKEIAVINYGLMRSNHHSKTLSLSKDSYKIITVARLVEQKDFQTLFRAFKKLTYIRNCELWIIGDGPLKKDLERLSRELSLENKIRFWGWQNDPSFYLKKSDIFVYSSHRDGLPYVIIEAMSYGLPIISTDTPSGPSEILNNQEYGILIPMQNETVMKNEMEKLLRDKKYYSYYSQQSLKRSAFFSEEKMLLSYKELISEVVENNPSAMFKKKSPK